MEWGIWIIYPYQEIWYVWVLDRPLTSYELKNKNAKTVHVRLDRQYMGFFIVRTNITFAAFWHIHTETFLTPGNNCCIAKVWNFWY